MPDGTSGSAATGWRGAGDAARRTHGCDRVERSGDAEDVALRFQARLRGVDPSAEAGEIPVVDRARRDGDHPAVRPGDQGRVGQRRVRERQHAAREQDRRSVRPGGGEVRRQRSARTEGRAADDVQEGELRRCGPASDLHELAQLIYQ